ncbi:hypothetical protein JOE38_002696 [Clavibacter michiganensis]|uniref:CmcI family methyltransferase n=1 Tax=Clavibacter michiganensis TaxID=28447 RepID=UPI0019583351|nr:CmcI family methyltransferase [Clavibacter michiganensis]MBM7412873.1 hypothetical protein [Clavibacter michiganensis]
MTEGSEDRLRLLLDWAAMRLERERVPNAFDNAVFSISRALVQDSFSVVNRDAALDVLEELVTVERGASSSERFVPLAKRLLDVHGSRALPPLGYLLGQGVNRSPTWRGRQIFKSVWDMAIYNELLFELRPGVIVELGSGDGASADWFSTLASAFSLEAEVVSFDASPPDTPSGAGMQFVKARFPEDTDRLISWTETLDPGRPWLVVEDMHVGIEIVLPAIVRVLRPGDYLVVEDSAHKQDVIRSLAAGEVELDVDQSYTDRFGVNGTSAMNSILRVR